MKTYHLPKRYRRKNKHDDLPKFTYGLEGKLIGLIGEPILLAHRAVEKRFPSVLSTNVGTDIRHTYHTQKQLTYMDLEAKSDSHLFADVFWKEQEKIFPPMFPTTTRRFNFRVDLWENSEGKFSKFSFALEVI